MHSRRSFAVGLVVTVIALWAARPAAAVGADEFIHGIGTTAIGSLTEAGISEEERENRFRNILRTSFDLPEIARFTLGVYWRSATPQQREEFEKLFEDFVVKSYAYRFKDYDGEQFRVTNVIEVSATDKVVQSEIARTSAPPIRMHWRVRGNSQFKIMDVVLEGVSMLTTQRDEFTAVIRNNGGKVEGLLAALRQRIGQAAQRRQQQ